MGFELNEKIKNLVPYSPIAGDFEIRLDANESFINLSGDLKKEITKAISEIDFNRYPDCTALDVCKKFANYYNVNEECVVAYNGSDESIFVIMNSFLDKNDKVVILVPDFSMYKFYCSLVECECLEYQKDEEFRVDFKEVTKLVNDNNVRMVIFSNPCNPTSIGFKTEDIRYLIENTNALIVLDEAYMDFWNESMVTEAENYDNLIVLKTCSKAVGFASARLGFTIANKTLTNVLRASKSPYNVNTLTQVSAGVLLEKQTYLNECTEKIVNSVKDLYSNIKELEKEIPYKFKVYDTNTNFVFIKTEDAKDIFEYLKSKSIIVRCINSKYLRITAGTDIENTKVIENLKSYYKVG